MKLSQAILIASVSGYTPPKPYRKALAKNNDVTCPELNTMDWYSESGHVVVSCSDGNNVDSICKLSCQAPYVSAVAGKPYDTFKVQCRGSDPTWKNVKNASDTRENFTCVLCPPITKQSSVSTKILKTWKNKDPKLHGAELRVKFDTAHFKTGCDDFLFGVWFKTQITPAAEIDIYNAEPSFISSNGEFVTFTPDEPVKSLDHAFWRKTANQNRGLGFTRMHIQQEDLSGLPTTDTAVKTYLYCQDLATIGTKIDDLSCHWDPLQESIKFGMTIDETEDEAAEDTTNSTESTDGTTDDTTSDSCPVCEVCDAGDNTDDATDDSTIDNNDDASTGDDATDDGSTTPAPAGCFTGSHSFENTFHAWQEGNEWKQKGSFTVSTTEQIHGSWTMEVTFERPVLSMQFWAGTTEKLDSAGLKWKFTGNPTWTHSSPLVTQYIMGTEDDQPNAATSVVWCPLVEGDGGDVTDATNTGSGTGNDTNTGTDSETDSGTDSGTDDGTDEPTSTPAPGPEPTGGVWDGSNFGTVQDCSGPRHVPVAYPTSQTVPAFKDGATDYEKLIHLSILFFEAQRSGPLPTTQRVPWRGDSGLHDGCDVGVDLRGGYFDAGDFVKFNFPQAAALTNLAWGALSFRTAYQSAGEWENVLEQIKWGTDYLIKCHSEPNVLYGQVGNGHIDHANWHRPEEIQYQTPAYKIDVNNPGSDLAGETAAALAAASKVFEKAGDTTYSAELLQHAKELFNFANNHRGSYTQGISDAGDFYNSWSGYNDELILAAIWVARASGDASDIAKAEELYQTLGGSAQQSEYSWDNKFMALPILMYELTNDDQYKATAKANMRTLRNNANYTPDGMIHLQQWGSARHAANVAFLATIYVKRSVDKAENRAFAQTQVNYIKGGNSRSQSFVVGWDDSSPTRPHHASSSCPIDGSTCGWDDLNASGPNPLVLYGALVGGPDASDNYKDDRNDYIHNEVTLDYNAGWQGALAGLQFDINNS